MKEKQEIGTYEALEKFSKLKNVEEVKIIENTSDIELGDFIDLHKGADNDLRNNSQARKIKINNIINNLKTYEKEEVSFSDIVNKLEDGVFVGRVQKAKKYAYGCIKKNGKDGS